MKFTISKLDDSLVVDGKKVSKENLEIWAKYALTIVREGGSISELPQEGENAPSLADIIYYINENMGEEKAKAESLRLAVVKERLHAEVERFRKNPSPDNEKVVTKLDAAYKNFLAHSNMDASVFIQFHKLVEDSFWEEVQPAYPHDAATIEKYRDIDVLLGNKAKE